MMWKDEIVDELHAMREAHAASLGYDAQKLYEELKAHEQLSRSKGFQFVSYPPRRPKGWIQPVELAT